MYTLTLTAGERKAIDFVGFRYEHGEDLRWMLDSLIASDAIAHLWDEDMDISFEFEEHEAWDFKNTFENCQWDLFAPSLVQKMLNFMDEII